MPFLPSREHNNWTVTVEEDPATGDLLLPFPPDLLSQMGWAEGTELFWIDNNNGSYTITDTKEYNNEKNTNNGTSGIRQDNPSK